MSGAISAGLANPRVRRFAPWVGVAAVLLALGIVSSGGSGGAPLDPNGTSRQGAKALVLLLRQYGATVTIEPGLPGPGVGAAVVLSDQLDSSRRDQLQDWVRQGGTLVVADPRSPLQVGAATDVSSGFGSQDLHPSGPCGVPGTTGTGRVSVGPSLLLRLAPGEVATTCYQLSDHADTWFLVAVRVGAGRVVGLGGAGLWTNQRLDQDDNAALAVGLLAPSDGARVAVLVASHPGSGHRSLLDLLSPRLKSSLIELLVAFGALAWWRGRRLGRPISEEGPVKVAGSEIVVAVGDLLARTGNRDAAAQQLRDATRARLGEWLGVGPQALPAHVADALAARIGTPSDLTLGLLSPGPLPDDAALVRLAQSLAELRQEVTRGRSVSPA